MEQSSDISTLENEFGRKFLTNPVPSSSHESSLGSMLSSQVENRDEEPPSSSDRSSANSHVLPSGATFVHGTTGSKYETITMMEKTNCPCCQQSIGIGIRHSTRNDSLQLARQTPSLFTLADEDKSDNDDFMNEDGHSSSGTLKDGKQYYPTSVLVQGWLHKKGTGKDWLGCTSWKARWARVITAKVDGYHCEVPLLQMFWHSSAPIPSTVILLESTVVLAIDLGNKEEWDNYRFELRHATTKDNPTISVTRTFTAPKLSRDTWVYMISEALLSFQKNMAFYKKKSMLYTSRCRDQSFVRPLSPPSNNETSTSPCRTRIVTQGDHSESFEARRPTCPLSHRLPRPNRTVQPTTSSTQHSRIFRVAKENAPGWNAITKTDNNAWYVYPPALACTKK